jgi:toxin ParE1/3/4
VLLREAGRQAARGFVDGLQQAYSHISRLPRSGSPRYAVELSLPGLPAWPLKRFPHIVFYIEAENYIDGWRVLNGGRDIPAWMQEQDPEQTAGP